MSAFKGTPGPWRWDDSYSTIDGRRTWTLVGSDGSGILSCDGLVNSPQEIGCESEARLIAAAPELLDALRHLTRLAGGVPTGVTQDMKREALKMARAAIEKATGGAA